MGDERKDKQKQQERFNEQRKEHYRNDRQREHGTGDGGAELREKHDDGKSHKDKA